MLRASNTAPRAPIRVILLCCAIAATLALSVASPPIARSATHVLYARTLSASSTNDWVNESYAAGAPQADCQNASNYSTNDVSTSADYLEVTGWNTLTLAANEVITQVQVDVDGRYDTNTSSDRFGMRVRGTVTSTTQVTPTWSQSSTDDACRWRMGGNGWDVTSLRSSWTESDIAGLRVAVRRYDGNDAVVPERARVNAFRVIVTTATCTPSCSVDPFELDYGTLAVGSSAEQTVTITNTGSCPVSGTVVFDGAADGFAIVSGGGAYTLNPGGARTVVVRFSPTAEVDYFGTLITSDTCDPVDCYGTGSACVVTPIDIDFGSVPVGQAATRSFSISNTGPGTLVGEVVPDCAGQPFAIASGGGAYALALGEQRTVTIQFAPVQPGTYTCTIGTGDDCEDDVTLVGTATGTAQVDIAPAAIDFDVLDVGDSADVGVTLTNRGTASASGSVSMDCPSSEFRIVQGAGSWTLAPGASWTITLRFAPRYEADHECNLSTGAGLVPVTASAWASEACMVEPTELGFGPLAEGDSQTRTFTIHNASADPLGGSVDLDLGCDDQGFSVDAGSGPYVLQPGESRVVVIRYTEIGAVPDGCTIDPGIDCSDYVGLVVNSGTAAVEDELHLAPGFVALGPNPFRESAVIRCAVPRGERASLVVYDVLGRRVREFDLASRSAMLHSITWDGRDEQGRTVHPGTYFARLAIGSQHWTRTLIRLR